MNSDRKSFSGAVGFNVGARDKQLSDKRTSFILSMEWSYSVPRSATRR